MNITLYKSNSNLNVIGKNITYKGSITGVWKDNTSLLQPVIVINTQSLTDVNYLYIDDFGRYYFINDINALTGGRLEINCTVDPLESWKAQIKAQTAVIARQANLYNSYLDDQNYRVYNNPLIQLKDFPNGFENWSYVLAVAGGQ